MRAAKSLDGMVLLALRGLDRIKQLEQQLAAITAGSSKPAEPAALGIHSTRGSATPIDALMIVAGVDVAPLATAANIIGLVERAASHEWASESVTLRASLRMARVLVQETLEDLKAASARGAS